MSTTPEAANELVARIVAAFPSAHVGVETRVLWAEQMRQVSEATARAAVAAIVREQKRFPAIADFWQAVDRHREATAERQPSERALPAGQCDECDGTGWTFTTNPQTTPGDVVRCSRGCMPPRPNKQFVAPVEDGDDEWRERGREGVRKAREILRGAADRMKLPSDL